MAIDYQSLASTDPTADSTLYQDPSQNVDATITPDLSTSTVDFFGGTPLSTDTYTPQPQTSPDQLPAAPIASGSLGQGLSIPGAGNAPAAPFKLPPGATYLGKTSDFQAQAGRPVPPPNFKLPPGATYLGPTSQAGQSRAPSPSQFGNDPFGQIMQKESQMSPEWRTALQSAQENILPGLAGGAAFGAVAGLGIGDAITIPLGGLIGLGVGLVGAFLAQGAAAKAQDAIIKGIVPEQDLQAYDSQRQKDIQDHPLENLAGSLASQGIFMKPSLSNIRDAFKAATIISTKGASGFAELQASNPELLRALSNVALGSTTQGGMEAWNQIQQGQFQPAQLAASILSGALLTEPNRVGNRLGLHSTQLDGLKAAQGVLKNDQLVHLKDLGAPGDILQQARIALDKGNHDEYANLVGQAERAVAGMGQVNPEEQPVAQTPGVPETPPGASVNPQEATFTDQIDPLRLPTRFRGTTPPAEQNAPGLSPEEARATIARANAAVTPQVQDQFQYGREQFNPRTGDQVYLDGNPAEVLSTDFDRAVVRTMDGTEHEVNLSELEREQVTQNRPTLGYARNQTGRIQGVGNVTVPKNLPWDLSQNSRLLDAKLKTDGGFTHQPLTHNEPKTGYAVGVYPERGQTLPDEQVSPDTHMDFVVNNIDLLQDPNNYFGAFREGGQTSLDISKVVSDPAEAMELARQANQQSIWDFRNSEAIPNPDYNPQGEINGLQQTSTSIGQGNGQDQGASKGGQVLSFGKASQTGLKANKGTIGTEATGAASGPSDLPNLAQARSTSPASTTPTDVTTQPSSPRSSATVEQSAAQNRSTTNAGSTRGSAPTVLVPLRALGDEVAAAARALGIDDNKPLPQFNQAAPVGQEEFIASRQPHPDPSSLVLDDTAPVPQVPPASELDGLRSIENYLTSQGINVKAFPVKVTDTPTLLALVAHGYGGKDWYTNSRNYINSLTFLDAKQKTAFQGLIAAAGQGQGVDANARLAIVYLSRIESGLLGLNLEQRDQLMDLGLMKKDGMKGRLDIGNLNNMLQGLQATTRKIEQYRSSLFPGDSGEGNPAIDMWMLRLFFDRDGVSSGAVNQKAVDYAEGRIRYLARSLGMKTEEVQASLWVGYKNLLADHLDNLSRGIAQLGTPEANAFRGQIARLKATTTGGQDLGTSLASLGVTHGENLPQIKADYVLAKWKNQLINVMDQGGAFYRYIANRPSAKADDIVLADKEVLGAFRKNPKMRDELADLYREFYAKPENLPGQMNAAQKDLGPAAEAIAYRAYVDKYPQEVMTELKKAANEMLFNTDQKLDASNPLGRFIPHAELEDHARNALDKLISLGIDPHGLHDVELDPTIDDIAHWSEDRPQTLVLNPARMGLTKLWQIAGTNLMESARMSKRDLTPASMKFIQKTSTNFGNATDADAVFHVVAHEAIHPMTYRALGIRTISEAPKALFNKMPREWWTNLLDEGMAPEVEAVVKDQTGQTLNEWLVGKGEKAGKARNIMNLEQATTNLLEHLDYQIGEHFDQDPLHSGSMASDEVIKRKIDDRKTPEQNSAIAGAWYRQTLQAPEVAQSIAAEAANRPGAGAVTTAILRSDAQSANVAAFPGAEPTRPSTLGYSVGGRNALTADQNRVIATVSERYLDLKQNADTISTRLSMGRSADPSGDMNTLSLINGRLMDLQKYIDELRNSNGRTLGFARTYKMPTIVKATAEAAQLPRGKTEGDAAYAERVVKHAGILSGQNWASAEHVKGIIDSGRDGLPANIETKGNQAYTKMGDRLYRGTPTQIYHSMDESFVGILDKVTATAEHIRSQDPLPVSPTKLDPEQLHLSLTTDTPPVRSTAAQGAVSVVDKTGKPIPAISAEHIYQTRQTVPSGTVDTQTAINQIDAHAQILDESLAAQKSLTHELDPELINADAKAAADEAAANAPDVTDTTPARLSPPTPDTIGMTGEDRKAATEQYQKTQTSAATKNYMNAFKNARQVADTTNDPKLRDVANNLNDLVASLTNSWDLAHWMKDPRTWFQSVAGKVNAVQMLYSRLGQDISAAITDKEGVRNALDVPNEQVRQRRLEALNPQDRAVADLLHHYWQLMGDIGKRTGVLKSYLEHYLPHIIKAAPGERVFSVNSGTLSTKTASAIERVKDEYGDNLYSTVNELQGHLNTLGLNSTVLDDVGEIFAAHGRGMTQAMLMKQFVNRMWGDFEVQVGKLPDQKAGAIRTLAGVRQLPKELQDQYRTIQFGPMKNVTTFDRTNFDRNNSYTRSEPLQVWKPLADHMERLASVYDMPSNPLTSVAQRVNSLNGIFKQYKFVSPTHAYSMMSNIATMSSKSGLFGLPAIFNPTTYKLLGNGRDIVEGANRTKYYRGLSAGLPAERTPESMGGLTEYMDKLPIAGGFFKWFHNIMWNQIGYNGTFGLWDHLVNEWKLQNPSLATDEASLQAAEKEMAYHAKTATGFLTSLDMSKNWDLLGNSLFLANKWTTGQVRTLGTAFNIGPLKGITNPLKNLGGERVIEGPTPEMTDMLQRKNIALAQRLVLGGTARLLMTSMVMSTAVSSLLNNGVPYSPIQNWMKDPSHVWDIYAGRDPVSNRDRWIRNPFYLFQRELADYAIAGVKAHNDGQDTWTTVSAPFTSFANKANPISKLGIEMTLGQEINMWMKGYGNSNIDKDKYITNIHQSLNSMGIPDVGSFENRILYAFQQLAPTPGLSFPSNLNQPTNDPLAVAKALGVGQFADPQTLALGAMGTRESSGTQYVQTQAGEIPVSQSFRARDQIVTMVKAMSSDPAVQQIQWQQIEQLRQQANLSAGQMTQLIEHGATPSQPADSKGILNGTQPAGTPASTGPKVKTISGVQLTPQQNVLYENAASQRVEYALSQVLNDPNWSNLDNSQKTAEANAMVSYANKITDEQFGRMIAKRPGAPISNLEANQMLMDVTTIKRQTLADLQKTPTFQQASPQDQQIMLADRTTATHNAVWDKYFGNPNGSGPNIPQYKGATSSQLLQAIELQANLRDTVRTTLAALPGWQGAATPYLQGQMLSAALKYADTVSNQMLAGTAPRTFSKQLNAAQLFTTVRNGVILQDQALSELHNSPTYMMADPKTQTTLDAKYIALAHNIALYDTREGFNTAAGQGYQDAIRTQLAADEGYQQLLNTYGGPQQIDTFSKELADLKTLFKQENNVAPRYLNSYLAKIDQWYYANHPQYYAFVTARKNWERYDPLGQAYQSIASSDLGYQAASPLAGLEPALQSNN